MENLVLRIVLNRSLHFKGVIFHTQFLVNYWDNLSGTACHFHYSHVQLHSGTFLTWTFSHMPFSVQQTPVKRARARPWTWTRRDTFLVSVRRQTSWSLLVFFIWYSTSLTDRSFFFCDPRTVNKLQTQMHRQCSLVIGSTAWNHLSPDMLVPICMQHFPLNVTRSWGGKLAVQMSTLFSFTHMGNVPKDFRYRLCVWKGL